jgi:hypothetical protein
MEKFVGVFCQKGPKFLNKVLATVPLVYNSIDFLFSALIQKFVKRTKAQKYLNLASRTNYLRG